MTSNIHTLSSLAIQHIFINQYTNEPIPFSQNLKGRRSEFEDRAIKWYENNKDTLSLNNILFWGNEHITNKDEWTNSNQPPSIYTNIMNEYMSRVD